jgi:hypothetical protein
MPGELHSIRFMMFKKAHVPLLVKGHKDSREGYLRHGKSGVIGVKKTGKGGTDGGKHAYRFARFHQSPIHAA